MEEFAKILVQIGVGAILLIASYQDIRWRRIFWPLPLFGLIACSLLQLATGGLSLGEHALSLAFGGILYLMARCSRQSMGEGDALLVAMIGTLLGPFQAVWIYLVASLLLVLAGFASWGIQRILGHRRFSLRSYALPFAPLLSVTFGLYRLGEIAYAAKGV